MLSKALLVLAFFEFEMRFDSLLLFLSYSVISRALDPLKETSMGVLLQFTQPYKIINTVLYLR